MTYKTDKENLIHRFELKNKKIVLDINSGAIHDFDALAWDVLDAYLKGTEDNAVMSLKSKYSEEDVRETYREIKYLEENNLLFTKPVTNIPTCGGDEDVVKAICLHISHACNLNCMYCFADGGDFGGQCSYMDLDTAKKALDFLLERSGNRRNCEVDFFGGEPVLNFSTIVETVKYGEQRAKELGKTIKFTLTTNATTVTPEILSFLKEKKISMVLSHDGREDVHNKARAKGNAVGNYENVTKNIKTFVNNYGDENYYVRGTFTRNNLDFSNDVIHLADLGFKYISVEPVVAPDEAAYSIREEDLEKINFEYEKLADELIKRTKDGNPFSFFHFNIQLDNGPCISKRVSNCGAGVAYLAITPEGDIYPCHQFVGREHFKLGSVHNAEFNSDVVKTFKNNTLFSKEECRDCWARFYCSGGCHANSHLITGDINKSYKVGCQMTKKRMECAIYTQVVLSS